MLQLAREASLGARIEPLGELHRDRARALCGSALANVRNQRTTYPPPVHSFMIVKTFVLCGKGCLLDGFGNLADAFDRLAILGLDEEEPFAVVAHDNAGLARKSRELSIEGRDDPFRP